MICTDGDKGYYWIFTNAERNRRVRQAEARAAAAAWNAKSVEFLGYPDRFLHANDEVVGRIEEAINKYRPEFILKRSTGNSHHGRVTKTTGVPVTRHEDCG